jgi:hypothetical protein
LPAPGHYDIPSTFDNKRKSLNFGTSLNASFIHLDT